MSKLFKVSDIFLVPNLITILRFFLIAPMIITYKNGLQTYFLSILFISLLTDFLDGIAARILNQKSELGKTLDPIADGITLFAFIILFNQEGLISNWFMIFYLITVLIGTVYPFFTEVLTDHKVSIGPPFYNTVIIPIVVLFLFFIHIPIFFLSEKVLTLYSLSDFIIELSMIVKKFLISLFLLVRSIRK